MAFLPPANGFQRGLSIRIIREINERISCPESTPDFLYLNFLVWSPKVGCFLKAPQVTIRFGTETHGIGKRSW